ncbi:MAG TPA: hypothetical protein VHM26_05420, partial [Chitinophagaceae bacterium]|nr:hypothetical protein [Chitinophagaceae bacterium]
MKLIAVLFSVLFCINTYSQDTLSRRHSDTTTTQKIIGLVAGLHFGKYIYGEVGIGRAFAQINPRHGIFCSIIGVSSEIQIGEDIMIAPKISLVAGSMGMMEGLNFLYYTDFSGRRGTFVFRPEAGFGVSVARLVYGYNIRFGDKRMAGIPSHMVSLMA